jgi:hypothetical protein
MHASFEFCRIARLVQHFINVWWFRSSMWLLSHLKPLSPALGFFVAPNGRSSKRVVAAPPVRQRPPDPSCSLPIPRVVGHSHPTYSNGPHSLRFTTAVLVGSNTHRVPDSNAQRFSSVRYAPPYPAQQRHPSSATAIDAAFGMCGSVEDATHWGCTRPATGTCKLSSLTVL